METWSSPNREILLERLWYGIKAPKFVSHLSVPY